MVGWLDGWMADWLTDCPDGLQLHLSHQEMGLLVYFFPFSDFIAHVGLYRQFALRSMTLLVYIC